MARENRRGNQEWTFQRHWQQWADTHAAVSRNRYGVEKTVDTHKILINAITFYVCLQEI
jgi:hypothetical protein